MSCSVSFHWRILTLSTAFLLVSSLRLFAQKADEMRIEHITEEQGMSSSVVNTIFQDKQGMLWFGAFDGLNEYNGMTFRHFRQSLPDSLSDGITTIRHIAQDFTGALWLATNNKRTVSRFNPITQTFYSIPVGGKNSPIMVRTILEDADNILWFATSRGLYRLDRPNMSIQEYSESNALASMEIIALAEDVSKTLWIATKTSIYALNRERTSLHKLESAFQSDITTLVVQSGAQSDSAQTLLWLGTQAHGIICINSKTSQIQDSFTQVQGLTSNRFTL
jgi:ligand-binding sensor domain-containing protein